MTADALAYRVEHGRLDLDSRSVVIFDEAGMADTRRLAHLVELTRDADAKLVLAGDSAQLSSIGAGGLFSEIADRAPTATLTEVYRANHGWEREAWAHLREGEAERALAAYHARDRLHLEETRGEAGERMVADWARTREEHPGERVVMITDASNHELDRLNQQAQEQRALAGQLGAERVALPDRPYGFARGDEILFASQHRVPGEQRVENGTRGQVVAVDERASSVTVRTAEPAPREVEVNTRESDGLRLAYAQHVYKAQGLTTDRALVLTGGWQTDREHAYVALSRAREQTDVYAARDDLGHQGIDSDAISRLAERMSESRAQEASVSRLPLNEPARSEPRQQSSVELPEPPLQPSRDSERDEDPRSWFAHELQEIRSPQAEHALEHQSHPAVERNRDQEPQSWFAQQLHELRSHPAEHELERDTDPAIDRSAQDERDERPQSWFAQQLEEIRSQQAEHELDHNRGEGIEI